MADPLIFELWNDFSTFTTFTVMMAAALGALGSRSMAVGAYGAYLIFVRIALESGDTLMTNIVYVSLVMVIMGMGFKLWRLELGGD